MRILAIDDEKIYLRIIETALSKKGYQVFTASSAQEGLVEALKETPDLILLDYMMLDRTGLDLLKDFRAVPELKNVPVVMITASGEREVVQKAITLGVTDFLVKPVNVDTLLDRVRKCLHQ
jgi:DNA-binding response OmpR family regulator